MSERGKEPAFLQPFNYRQRRLRDAVRVLPVAGLIGWLFPLAWSGEGTATVVQYVFVIWVLLIALAFFIARVMQPDDES